MDIHDDEMRYAIALTMVEGIGPSRAKNLIAFCGSARAVFEEKKSNLLRIPDIGLHSIRALKKSNTMHRAEAECVFMEKYQVKPLLYHEAAYPDRLKLCNDSPVVLYTKGVADLNSQFTLSVVGTRSATSYGKSMCLELVRDLAKLRPLVISGLAYGIDICAHRAALQYEVHTVACLAHGLDRIYPPIHTTVAREIVGCGSLVTEFPSGTNPDRECFPSRNRIIAGMADCTVVVETDRSGGSIITAHLASGYGREVFAFPGRSTDRHSSGCNALIKQNLAAIVTGAEDLMEYMNWSIDAPVKEKQLVLFEPLTDEEKHLCKVLQGAGRVHLDRIATQSGMSLGQCSAMLLELEFKGAVKSLPGKVYEIHPSLTMVV